MKTAWSIFIVVFGFLASVKPLFAQVKINEFSSETSDDWVELYSSEAVDISGWILRDNATSVVATIPKETKIGLNSNQFYIIDAGNRLNKDGDSIKLFKTDDSTLVNQISYGSLEDLCIPETGQTAGRLPDGSDKITRFISATKGQTNMALEAPCPSPSPSPSPSPTPQSSPPAEQTSSSGSIQASPSPTPTPSPTPQPSKIYRIKEISLLQPSPKPEVLGSASGRTRYSPDQPDRQLVTLLILTGTGLVSAAAIIIIRLWRQS